MPAYSYKCNSCQKEWTEHHGFDEKPEVCPYCETNNIKKTFNYTITAQLKIQEMQSKNGQKTREYIEQARQDLKQFKTESRK